MKTSKVKLTLQDIRHIANLAGLSFDEKNLISQLEETITYIENLGELYTENVPPSKSVIYIKNCFFKDGEKSNSFTQEEALSQAKNIKDGHFVVEKIL